MPRRLPEKDETDHRDDEWHGEDDGEADPAVDDEEPTVPCPYCKRAIHEESQLCPYCDQYISQVDAPATRQPWWIIMGVVLCLYVVIRWLAS